MCTCYGRQLIDAGDVRKGVSYLLSAGLQTEAMDVLISHQLHRETVALARCTSNAANNGESEVSSGESLVNRSLSHWAAKAAQDSNLELAAKCFLACGSVQEAARVLVPILNVS